MLWRDYSVKTKAGDSCNGNKSSGSMNPCLHYSSPFDGCCSGEIPAESFQVGCLILTVKHEEDSCMLWGAIYSYGFMLLVDLMGMITSDHYQSILADHLHPMLQTLFPREHSVLQNDNGPIFTHLPGFKYGYMSMMMKSNI